MRVRILGKHWRLRLNVPGLANAADIDPPNARDKAIRIGTDQERELELIIHECLHGAGWHIEEPFVEQFAADVAAILKRCGYRKEPS